MLICGYFLNSCIYMDIFMNTNGNSYYFKIYIYII